MAFVRVQKRGNRVYYYFVQTHREGKKVRQNVLKYLGTAPPGPDELERLKEEFKDRLPPPKKRGRKPKEER
jgi:hypothetical protein